MHASQGKLAAVKIITEVMEHFEMRGYLPQLPRRHGSYNPHEYEEHHEQRLVGLYQLDRPDTLRPSNLHYTSKSLIRTCSKEAQLANLPTGQPAHWHPLKEAKR